MSCVLCFLYIFLFFIFIFSGSFRIIITRTMTIFPSMIVSVCPCNEYLFAIYPTQTVALVPCQRRHCSGKYSRLSMFRNRRSHECTNLLLQCPRRHHKAVLRGTPRLFSLFVSDVFHLSGKFSTTGKPLYANFHLREDECVTKIEDETHVNAKKPSPSEVRWDFAVRSTQALIYT